MGKTENPYTVLNACRSMDLNKIRGIVRNFLPRSVVIIDNTIEAPACIDMRSMSIYINQELLADIAMRANPNCDQLNWKDLKSELEKLAIGLNLHEIGHGLYTASFEVSEQAYNRHKTINIEVEEPKKINNKRKKVKENA